MENKRKKIVIITVDEKAAQLYKQTLEDLWGAETVEIGTFDRTSFWDDESIPSADLYVASKGNIEYLLGDFEHKLPLGIPLVDIRVTFQNEAIHGLAAIPDNTQCLFVNASEPLALECIVDLYRNSLYNLHLVPFWPEKEVPMDIDTAITVGGCELVPPHVKKVYDLGIRHLTPRTIAEICHALNMEYVLETDRYLDYLALFSPAEQNYGYVAKSSYYHRASAEILLETSSNGIIGINEEQKIFCINKNALSLLQLQKNHCIGEYYKSVLPFLEYDEFANVNTEYENQQKLYEYNGTLLDIFANAIVNDGKIRGLIVRLQRYEDKEDQMQNIRRKLLRKGHPAKYVFNDIITQNPVMVSLCRMAARMAETKSSILITGESGTGKELLASAIHNASARAQYPYIAINCAAMPEPLLDSELFGYEEGAFTGARKNGKAGLFEHAHRGTIFLDEIENMSPMLQIKLLRVLQEKEIMHVGGSRLINVDVRIIAATNENMEEKVKKGEFRKDLYYRLNTMELNIPPLRERKDDIPLLLEHFKKEEDSDFNFSEEAMECLCEHSWDGNVRELRNCVEYLNCVNKKVIQVQDLPPKLSGYKKMAEIEGFTVTPDYRPGEARSLLLTEKEQFVLQCLFEAYRKQINVGRRILFEWAERNGMKLSEQAIRQTLKNLEEKGLVHVARGRGGSKLTHMGMQYCENEFL